MDRLRPAASFWLEVGTDAAIGGAWGLMPNPWDHGVAEVRLRHGAGTEEQTNCFHVVDLTGEATPEHYQFCVNAYAEWWSLPGGPADPPSRWVGAEASLVDGFITWLLTRGPLGRVGVVSRLLPIPGLGVGPPLPGNATKAVEWMTFRGGRHGHGRSYMPFLDTNLLSSHQPSRLEPGVLGLVAASYASLVDFVTSSTDPPGIFMPVVWHRGGWLQPDGTTQYWSRISGARVNGTELDSQVRRLPLHHPHDGD